MNRVFFSRLLEVLAVIAVGALVWSNFTLRREVRALQQALQHESQRTSPRAWQPGEIFDPAGLTAPDGHTFTPRGRVRGMMLVTVVDPTCTSCDAAAAEVGSRLRNMAASPMVVSNSADVAATAAFAARHGIQGVTFRVPETLAPHLRLKFAQAPQVFLVRDGRVTTTCPTVSDCLAKVAAKR
ncbi:MAG TPA: hypothetical protein VHK90_01450 [Thermoanaerobaculia bacterium]|nr:hypothetical protein [Thermoanaerobaculia bacterium]